MKLITGLHHVTAITGNAQENIDFYTGVLGLRLVKKRLILITRMFIILFR